MIARYNLRENLRALFCVIGSVLGYLAAYWFFRFVVWLFGHEMGIPALMQFQKEISGGVLVLITLSGWMHWRTHGDFYRFDQSGLQNPLDPRASGSAYMLDRYVHRVTGPAWVLSQVFLAGPLLAFRATVHRRNVIPANSQLESALQETLETLRRANKWQSLTEYPDREVEIFLLARMGEIDFSAAKGTPRFKARFPASPAFARGEDEWG